MTERRDFNRWPIMVEVTVDSAHTFYQKPGDRVFTWDISEGGIFIGARRPQPVGTRLRFQFTLPDSDDPIAATGEVQWVTSTMELPAVGSNHHFRTQNPAPFHWTNRHCVHRDGIRTRDSGFADRPLDHLGTRWCHHKQKRPGWRAGPSGIRT